jgi:hypothetical protein
LHRASSTGAPANHYACNEYAQRKRSTSQAFHHDSHS